MHHHAASAAAGERPEAGRAVRIGNADIQQRLELLALHLDGRELGPQDYQLEQASLRIPGVPERFELETQVRIRPQDNTELEGLYRSGGLFCSQCEAEGFRRITFFPDRPDVMARFSTSISADSRSSTSTIPKGAGQLPRA